MFDIEAVAREGHVSAIQEIQIIPVMSDQLAPLYERYPNNLTPCQASMVLRMSREVRFRVNIQGGYTHDTYNGRERIWDIPPELSKTELKDFGEKLKKLLSQVHRGLHTSWDECSCEERGILTPEAQEASDKIQAKCDQLFELVSWQDLGVYMIEPSDYFDSELPEDYGLDADSSDDDIRKEAEELLEHFNANNIMMYGEMFQMIKERVKGDEYY